MAECCSTRRAFPGCLLQPAGEGVCVSDCCEHPCTLSTHFGQAAVPTHCPLQAPCLLISTPGRGHRPTWGQEETRAQGKKPKDTELTAARAEKQHQEGVEGDSLAHPGDKHLVESDRRNHKDINRLHLLSTHYVSGHGSTHSVLPRASVILCHHWRN